MSAPTYYAQEAEAEYALDNCGVWWELDAAEYSEFHESAAELAETENERGEDD